MPRLNRNALTAPQVPTLGPGRYVDGNGLMLYVKKSGARAWVQRLMIAGHRADMGLGSADRDSAEYVTLTDVRKVAAENRRIARAGGDPRRAKVPTFDAAQAAALAENAPRWNEGGRLAAKWTQTMRDYVLPKIGDVAVSEIGRRHVKLALAPIAAAGKLDTVDRTGDRIAQTLDWAYCEDYRDDNGAEDVKDVVKSLRKGRGVGQRRHMRAMPHAEVAAALATVEADGTARATRLAFRFMVLTAARTLEVRTMVWSDVDMDTATWNRPADKMKARVAHRVPLSRQALDVLAQARGSVDRRHPSGVVFPTPKGAMLGDNALRKLTARAVANATPHGFRSSFRDWCGETGVERDAAELSLAHAVGDQTERAYARSDLLERRRPVMQAWADYIAP